MASISRTRRFSIRDLLWIIPDSTTAGPASMPGSELTESRDAGSRTSMVGCIALGGPELRGMLSKPGPTRVFPGETALTCVSRERSRSAVTGSTDLLVQPSASRTQRRRNLSHAGWALRWILCEHAVNEAPHMRWNLGHQLIELRRDT